MHATLQVKIPIDRAKTLDDRLKDLQAAHDKDVAQFQKKIKTTPHSDRLAAENAALIERGRRLAPGNLIRLVITKGCAAIEGAKVEDLLAELAEDSVVRGRPRGR